MPARPLGESGSRTHWQEPKRCRSLSLSDQAWALLTKLAAFHGVNRSEAFERLIRAACEETRVSGVNARMQEPHTEAT